MNFFFNKVVYCAKKLKLIRSISVDRPLFWHHLNERFPMRRQTVRIHPWEKLFKHRKCRVVTFLEACFNIAVG